MKKSTRILLICLFASVLVFSLWRLWNIFRAYQEGNNQYESLEQYATVLDYMDRDNTGETVSMVVEPSVTEIPEDNALVKENVDVSAWPQVDFEQLALINPDIVGWIYIDGTKINYPVAQADNNNYYLNRLFDGSRNAAGCIFLDYRSSSDFLDRHSIIYGHHMKDNSMFADLVLYKKQTFYDEHPVALFVTPDAYYEIQFFSGYVTDTWSDAWNLNIDETEFDNWLSQLRKKSYFEASACPSKEDRIITLSTCTYEYDTAKFVIHGYVSKCIDKPGIDDHK